VSNAPWTRRDQERFEDRIAAEIHELRGDVDRLATRFTLLLGGLGVLVFVVNISVAIWLSIR
jgi:hypothetical protein